MSLLECICLGFITLSHCFTGVLIETGSVFKNVSERAFKHNFQFSAATWKLLTWKLECYFSVQGETFNQTEIFLLNIDCIIYLCEASENLYFTEIKKERQVSLILAGVGLLRCITEFCQLMQAVMKSNSSLNVAPQTRSCTAPGDRLYSALLLRWDRSSSMGEMVFSHTGVKHSTFVYETLWRICVVGEPF